MKQPTKRDERKLMDRLKQEREKRSEHRSPDWVAAFWRRLAT